MRNAPCLDQGKRVARLSTVLLVNYFHFFREGEEISYVWMDNLMEENGAITEIDLSTVCQQVSAQYCRAVN